MTFYTKVVNVLARATTGDQDITFTPNGSDPSWTPKVAIVQWNRTCTSTSAWFEHSAYGIGWSDGTNQRCVCVGNEDNATTADTARVQSNTNLITALVHTGTMTTIDAAASFSSWLTNGMKLNWSNAPGAQFYLTILFLGGSDITNVDVGTITSISGTGTFSISSLAYQPDFGMFLFANSATMNTGLADAFLSLGAATSSSAQWSQSIYSQSTPTTMSTRQVHSHTKILDQHDTFLNGAVAFSSFNSDGFTLNSTTDLGSALPIFYLVMKGGSYVVNYSTEPGSTGNQTITTSVDVKAVAMFGVDTTSAGLDNVNLDCMWSGGFADNGINQFGHVFHDTNAAGTSIVASALDGANHIYNNITAAATVGSTLWDDSAIINSMTSTTFVINWDNIGQARPFQYITFGAGAAGTLFTTSITESSISVSETVDRIPIWVRSLPESAISVSDAVARTLTANRSISESSIAVSDSLARLLTAFRTISESSIAVSETLVRRLTANRSLSESAITVSDSLARLLIAVRALSESSIAVSETITALKIGATVVRSITESSIAVSETLARSLLSLRTLSEPSVAVSDSVTRLLTAFRSLSDTVVVSDSLVRTPIRVRSIAETAISVSDTVARMLTALRTLSESSIAVSESLARRLTANRSLAETVIVSETLARQLLAFRTLAESTITVSDTLARMVSVFRTLAEPSVLVSESVARMLNAFRILSESSIAVSDTVARQIVPTTVISETVVVSDSIARLLIANRSFLSEPTITISDILAAARLRVRFIDESAISVSDSLVKRLFAFRVIGETVFVSEVMLIVGPDYEIAAYIGDRGYANPLRARIQFISRTEPFNTYYTYDSFNPDARPFNILNMSVRLAQGEIGTFSMTIEDSAGIVDKSKIGLGTKVVIEAKKEFGTSYFKLITGFVRRIRPLRPATGALLYQVTGYGSQVVFNERVVNFKRAAKRTAVDSTIPLSTESRMQAWRLFTDLITATDIIPLRAPTIQATGKFELTAISPEVTDFIAQIAPGLTDAASVANAIAEITGAIWGTDADGNPFFRYPTQVHSGILVKDAPESTDLAANTSVNLDAFDFDDSIDVSEGFANRLYVLNAVDTQSTASSGGTLGSTTLTTRWLAQQWIATDNNVTSAAFVMSRVGNPTNTTGSIQGKLRQDNTGYPTGATLASFEITLDQIDTSKSTIFVNDIKTETSAIVPGNKYWWVLVGNFSDDSNTVRWHHDNDLSTPNRLSAHLPVVDADPTKPGIQAQWVRSVFGPVYAFSTFSSVRHILTQSDSESIKQFGLIEGIVDLPAFEDDATFQKALAKIIYTSAKPKRTYEYSRLTIPTQRIFYPGELITVIDSKASLTSEKNVMAEIAEINYNFDTGSNAIGCKYVDIRLVAFLDKTLDDYMDTREC